LEAKVDTLCGLLGAGACEWEQPGVTQRCSMGGGTRSDISKENTVAKFIQLASASKGYVLRRVNSSSPEKPRTLKR
jgi:hypothetical protein